jgi:hypothetical protein
MSPASCPVECAGVRHHLVWRDGQLTAFDHPDAERERTLTALGGDVYRCLQLAEAWERHAEDLDVLLLASRGSQDSFLAGRAPHDPRPGRHFGWFAYAPLSSMHGGDSPSDAADLPDLLGLGGGLPERLVGQVLDTWAIRLAEGDETVERARPRLQAALYGRFVAAVRTWLGDSELRVELSLVPPGAASVVERVGDRVRAELPFNWLTEVWLPGFAVVADRLCISVRQPGPQHFELTTLGRDLIEQATITVEIHPPQ